MGPPLSPYKCSVLVVDDEPLVREALRALLAGDFRVETAGSAEEARDCFERADFDVVVSDHQLPCQTGVQLLEWVRHRSPRAGRVLVSGHARLQDALDAINDGQVHRFLVKPFKPEHLLQVLRSAARNLLLERSHERLLEELRELNTELEWRVQQRTRELEEANRQLLQRNTMLQKMALTDPLTGLPNRRAMDRLARTELSRIARHPRPLAVGLIDADHFKEINNRYLLPGGDHALVWLAETLQNAVRATDAVGRIGGEEFLLVAPETDLDGAAVLAERVRRTVEAGSTTYLGEPIRVTVSVGMVVVTAPPPGYDAVKLAAAAALADAKRAGRNRCVVRTAAAAGV